jgi:hypothetical protein
MALDEALGPAPGTALNTRLGEALGAVIGEPLEPALGNPLGAALGEELGCELEPVLGGELSEIAVQGVRRLAQRLTLLTFNRGMLGSHLLRLAGCTLQKTRLYEQYVGYFADPVDISSSQESSS